MTPLLDLATALGVSLPEPVLDARAKRAAIRLLSRGTKPVVAHAAEILAAVDPAKALAKAATAVAGDKEVHALVVAANEAATRAVELVARECARPIAEAVLKSDAVIEAADVLAEIAPTLPADVSPTASVADTGEDTLVKVVRAARSWSLLAEVVDALHPEASPEDVALLLFDPSGVEDLHRFANAARGYRTSGDRFTASVAKTTDAPPVPRVIAPAALAHVPGVVLALVENLDEYHARRAAFRAVTSAQAQAAGVPRMGVIL